MSIHRTLVALTAAAIASSFAMTGCASPTTDDGDASEAALSGHQFDVGTILRVTATALNVRARGSSSATILAVVHRDDLVTVAATSGSSGWLNITSADGTTGWSSGLYLTVDDSSDTGSAAGSSSSDDTSTKDGATCAPTRATGVVNEFEKALHDTLAFAEGTRDQGMDGYNIIFGGSTVSSCAHHSTRCIAFGSTCSTAAGRYQFLTGTWNSIANVRGYATFEPENQERGAAYLISSVRKATVPTDRPLTAAEFSNVITKLSFEWASLPPGQYGQPSKSMSELRAVYCTAAGC